MVTDILKKFMKKRKQNAELIFNNEDNEHKEKEDLIIKKSKLDNILKFTKYIIDRYDNISTKEDLKYNIYSLIKVFTDKIINDNALGTISSDYSTASEYNFLKLMVCDDLHNEYIEKINKFIYIKSNVTDEIEISPASDPVITIGTESKSCKEKKDKYHLKLFLPIGVSIVHMNGNYSVYTGNLKRTGSIVVGGNTENMIYNIEDLLDYIKFDGKYYRKNDDNTVIGEACNFEFGCILEIGRILKDKNITFTYGRKYNGN